MKELLARDDRQRLCLGRDGQAFFRLDRLMKAATPGALLEDAAREAVDDLHLLIVDDWEGTNSLFEFDAEGTFLNSTPLIQYGRDPEGIAIRPGANQLFMAFDGGARIAAFDYTPTIDTGAPPRPGADCMIS